MEKRVNQKGSKMKPYTKDQIKQWISFGINNGYVNKFKKGEIAKWTELMLKHGVIDMKNTEKLLSDSES
jgi:hypothetical protein